MRGDLGFGFFRQSLIILKITKPKEMTIVKKIESTVK